ncbi:MAG: hypothetical protein ACYDHY_07150 [Acidiferrobacterales bacterium]
MDVLSVETASLCEMVDQANTAEITKRNGSLNDRGKSSRVGPKSNGSSKNVVISAKHAKEQNGWGNRFHWKWITSMDIRSMKKKTT